MAWRVYVDPCIPTYNLHTIINTKLKVTCILFKPLVAYTHSLMFDQDYGFGELPRAADTLDGDRDTSEA